MTADNAEETVNGGLFKFGHVKKMCDFSKAEIGIEVSFHVSDLLRVGIWSG